MSVSAERQSRSMRSLCEAEIAQSGGSGSPVTHAEAPDFSDGKDEGLGLAFRDISWGSAGVTQSGRWERDLALLFSDHHVVSTETGELEAFCKSFSVSLYLSPAGVHLNAPDAITINNGPIDGSLLICLALNEECRKTGAAVFYHLPPRQHLGVGHASDLVFMPRVWKREDKHEWDNAGWMQRLDQFSLDNDTNDKIDSSTLVIPICARILHFEENRQMTHSLGIDAADPSPVTPRRVLSNHALCDPAVRADKYCYSRPLQDLSTYLVLYPSIHTPPLVCTTSVFEDKAHSDRQPTPNDLSETFTLRYRCDSNELHNKIAIVMNQKSRKRYLAAGEPMCSNAEVVNCLLEAWNEEALKNHLTRRTDNGDKVRYFWQELKNMMDTGPETRELAANWPTT